MSVWFFLVGGGYGISPASRVSEYQDLRPSEFIVWAGE